MGYLFAAYTVIWVMLGFYLWMQGKRQKQLEKEIQLLSDLLGETSPSQKMVQ